MNWFSFFGNRGEATNEAENARFSKFPLIILEPWRVEELIREETATQKYRLFRSVNLLRLFLAIAVGILLFSTEQLSIATGMIMGLYAIVVSLFIVLAERQKEQINRFALLVGLFDVILIGVVFVTTQSALPFGILFLSILLSAMILPTFSALLITLVACLALIFSRFTGVLTELNLSLGSLTVQQWVQIGKLIFSPESEGMTQLLFMALGLILVTILVNQLAMRSFKNEVRAQFRYKQLRQVLAFNRTVIEQLRSGVIVLTHDAKIVSINQRAMDLLGINSSQALLHLQDISLDLHQRFSRWSRAGMESRLPYKHNIRAQEVSISFSSFGENESGVAMLTLESVNEAFQQSQQAKLASLGRLTAGVAHEIRNPLSSIKSANELLREASKELPNAQKLTSMINNNVERTNQIVDDILGLFKESQSKREMILLTKFLRTFADLFRKTNTDQSYDLKILVEKDKSLFVMFDPGQLEQVLWNLCQNALKYAEVTKGETLKIVVTAKSTPSGQAHIDVSDNGQGIATSKLEHIFEPFFTSGRGSGLGLYLVRELCGANNANIVYLDNVSTGATFRIVTQAFFAKVDKRSK